MSKFLATILVAGCALSVSWAQQTVDPAALYQKAISYRADLIKEARASKTQIDLADLNAKVQSKVSDWIKGIDLENVDGQQGLDWARLMDLVGDHQKCCDMAQKFLSTHPDDNQQFAAMFLMSKSCNELGEADMVARTLEDIPVPNSAASTQLANATIGSYIDTIFEKNGIEAALSSLGVVENKLIDESPKDYAQRMLKIEKSRPEGGAALIKDPNSKAKSDTDRLAELEKQGTFVNQTQRYRFDEKKADLLLKAGQKAEALRVLNSATARLSPENPNLRSAKSKMLQIEMEGSKAPAIVAGKSYGEFMGLDAWKGKVVIVDFFAHWCGPCIASFPDMKQMYADLHDQGLEVVSVTTYYGFFMAENTEKRDMAPDTEFARMGDFIKQYSLPWPVVVGERSNMANYGVTAIPTAVLIDREGNVHELHVGYSKESFAEFRKQVEELLAKS